jgi:hypothetical protein
VSYQRGNIAVNFTIYDVKNVAPWSPRCKILTIEIGNTRFAKTFPSLHVLYFANNKVHLWPLTYDTSHIFILISSYFCGDERHCKYATIEHILMNVTVQEMSKKHIEHVYIVCTQACNTSHN